MTARQIALPGEETARDKSASLELVCPAGTLASLRTAVDAGADVVYVGFADETNARNFPGLNFSRDGLREGIAYAHRHGTKVYLAVNTFPHAGADGPWRRAVDDGAALGVDAVILADPGLLAYTTRTHPGLRRHLSVQASLSNPIAIRHYHEQFGIRRIVLPRVMSLPEITALIAEIPVETEVFAFGGLCVMAEGRCALSTHITGQSPNRQGVCSPASHVRYEEEVSGRMTSRLGGYAINVFAPEETVGYPTLCKGRFAACGSVETSPGYLFEDPVSLNALTMLAAMRDAGIAALKIEGRQRGRAYVRQVVTAFRQALDALAAGAPVPPLDLDGLTEGGRETVGALERTWR